MYGKDRAHGMGCAPKDFLNKPTGSLAQTVNKSKTKHLQARATTMPACFVVLLFPFGLTPHVAVPMLT